MTVVSVGGQNITGMRGCVTCVRLTGQSVGPCESLPSPARGTHTVGLALLDCCLALESDQSQGQMSMADPDRRALVVQVYGGLLMPSQCLL